MVTSPAGVEAEVQEGVHLGKVGLTVSPDGELVAACWGLNNQSVRLWDAPTGVLVHTFEGPKADTVRSLAFSPDGAMLAAGARDCTRLLNIAERKEIGLVSGNVDTRGQVTWTADGKRLAVIRGILR